MNAHDLGAGRARRQATVSPAPFATDQAGAGSNRQQAPAAYNPIVGGPAPRRAQANLNAMSSEDKKEALRRERQAEYQAMLARKNFGGQNKQQQQNPNPLNGGGGGFGGGQQLSSVEQKKKAYREELEAQIQAKKDKARAEKEADRRPNQGVGPLVGDPSPPPHYASNMGGGAGLRTPQGPSPAPRMAFAAEPTFISPPRQREPAVNFGGGYGGGGGGYMDEPPPVMGGYGGYGAPQMGAPPPMYYPPQMMPPPMVPRGGYGAPPPFNAVGGSYGDGGGYGPPGGGRGVQFGPGPGMGGGGYGGGGGGGYGGDMGGGGYGGGGGGGGGMQYRRSSPPPVIASDEAAAFTRAKPSMPWEQGSNNNLAAGQRPRGMGLQELKGGAPPADNDRKAAYRRELEVQMREQQQRREIQKLEAKGLDGPPPQAEPAALSPQHVISQAQMEGMDAKQLRQLQYQQELRRQAEEQKAIKDAERKRLKEQEDAAEAKLKREQEKLREQYEAEQAKERQKVANAMADADAQREAAMKGGMPEKLKRQRTPSEAQPPQQQEPPQQPPAGKPPTPKAATPQAAGGPVDANELARLRNELAAEQEKLKKVVEDQMKDLKLLRDKAEQERIEHADVMRKLEDIRMEVKREPMVVLREMPRDYRGRYEKPAPYGDAYRDAQTRLAHAPPEVALAAGVSPAPSLVNARAPQHRQRARSPGSDMDRSMVGETMFIYADPNRSWGGSQISAGPGAAAAAALGQADPGRARGHHHQGLPPAAPKPSGSSASVLATQKRKEAFGWAPGADAGGSGSALSAKHGEHRRQALRTVDEDGVPVATAQAGVGAASVLTTTTQGAQSSLSGITSVMMDDLQARNAAKLAALDGVGKGGPPDVEQLDTLLQRFLDASHGANAQKSSVPAALKARAEELDKKDRGRGGGADGGKGVGESSNSLVAETRWVEASRPPAI